MGDSYLKTIVIIITPNIFSSLIEAFSYYFINAMVTVSAVIFIATAKTMVITAKIKELQYFEKFSEIFVLSIFILLTNLLAKLIFKIISNIINKKGRKNEKNNLSISTSIKDLQNPIYKGMLSITDIKSSSTAWLLIQALISEYGEDEAKSILKDIYANAGEHIESSGSAPIKKVRAGEVALGFGLRQKAVSDKKEGLPIDYVDPKEGNGEIYKDDITKLCDIF